MVVNRIGSRSAKPVSRPPFQCHVCLYHTVLHDTMMMMNAGRENKCHFISKMVWSFVYLNGRNYPVLSTPALHRTEYSVDLVQTLFCWTGHTACTSTVKSSRLITDQYPVSWNITKHNQKDVISANTTEQATKHPC